MKVYFTAFVRVLRYCYRSWNCYSRTYRALSLFSIGVFAFSLYHFRGEGWLWAYFYAALLGMAASIPAAIVAVREMPKAFEKMLKEGAL